MAMIQKEPCDVICDVTKSKKWKNEARRQDNIVLQQYVMCEFVLHHIMLENEQFQYHPICL